MPTIPRYQPRGGPSVGGLNYAGAYSPPDGSDWRLLSRAADAAGAVLSLLPKSGARAAWPEAGQTTGPAAGRVGANAESHLLAQAEEVRWRREQLQADQDALDYEAVARSRHEAAEGLPPDARRVFESLTAPREAGFAAAAAARAAERVREASRALSLERQSLGLDEYHALIDTAPEQAMAALGSAVSELGARLRENGADKAEIEAAQRALVSTSQSERVLRRLEHDPAGARDLLDASGGIAPEDREPLAATIDAEQLRLGVRREVGRWVSEDPSLAADQGALLAMADLAGGDDEALADLYRGAALSEWRGDQAREAARNAEALASVDALLADGRVRSWTDLPAHRWTELTPDQQAEFRARTEQGWGREESAMRVPVGLQDDFEVRLWPPSVKRKEEPPPGPRPRLPPRAIMTQQSEIMGDQFIGRSGTLDPKAQAQFDNRHAARLVLLESPEARAFMSVIAWAEGNVTYNSLAGDRQGRTYARGLSAGHPGRISGRYQIDPGTWGDFGEKKLGLTDYSDHSQDLAAVQIMKDGKILDALKKGQIRLASDLAAERWASFRKAGTEHSKFKYNGKWQPSKTRDEIVARYEIELAKERAKDAEKAAARSGRP